MVDGGWLVTNENINFAHYFSGPELSKELRSVLGSKCVGSRCGVFFGDKKRRPAAWQNDKTREPSKVCGRCLRSVLSLLPEPMRAAVKAQEPSFAAEMSQRYLLAEDDDTRADILAFFESDGPRKVHEAKLKHHDGIPTSSDLDEQLAPK